MQTGGPRPGAVSGASAYPVSEVRHPARASGYTLVPSGVGEIDHQGVFTAALGLGAHALDGFNPNSPLTQTFGSYQFTRVQDTPFGGSGGGALDIATPSTVGICDQLWHDGTTRFAARARYAALSQYFGYSTDGAGFTKVAWVKQNGINPEGAAEVEYFDNPLQLGGQPWSWERADNADGSGHRVSSLEDLNTEYEDHMVTYLVQGPGLGSQGFSWWVFWEDLTAPEHSDFDYNDLVMEFYVIPVPAAVVLVMCGVGLIGWTRRAVM